MKRKSGPSDKFIQIPQFDLPHLVTVGLSTTWVGSCAFVNLHFDRYLMALFDYDIENPDALA